MYEDGRGVPQDYAVAANWFRKAAVLDNATAQFNLGRMYENGRGVKAGLSRGDTLVPEGIGPG